MVFPYHGLGSMLGNAHQHPFSAQQYYSQAAEQLLGLQTQASNCYAPPPAPEAPKLRTQEEIIEQCKARLVEMEREAAELKAKEALPKCGDCRWKKGVGTYYRECHQPLVKGLGSAPLLRSSGTDLCGPEKALWEPRLSLITRIINWFTAPWRGY